MYIKDLKFSLWVDFIERDFLDNEFKELIKLGVVNGITSNPSIFKNAILNSSAYKHQLDSLNNLTAKEKYEAIAIVDIQKAADVLKPLFDKADDGYVSIEVDPFLCDDTKGTIQEAKRLYKNIARDNVMIKIPATISGYKAMEELISCGIAVNATLVFSKKQALFCAQAFKQGLKRANITVDTVISIFVSRFDRALDNILREKKISTSLAGIYNASVIYEAINSLHVKGCKVLFASTGVKDDRLIAQYYINELLAYNSINTAPIQTILAYTKKPNKQLKLPINNEKITDFFNTLSQNDIDFDMIIQQQIQNGLDAFKKAFMEIMEVL